MLEDGLHLYLWQLRLIKVGFVEAVHPQGQALRVNLTEVIVVAIELSEATLGGWHCLEESLHLSSGHLGTEYLLNLNIFKDIHKQLGRELGLALVCRNKKTFLKHAQKRLFSLFLGGLSMS